MILNINNPSWVNQIQNIPTIYDIVKIRLKKIMSEKPEVTVCIIAHNEERNVLRCLNSLSQTVSTVPFDIIVVNNNSTDRTQEVLDKVEVTSFFQPVQGCGVAREFAQQNAKGTYVLLADADCLYPKDWIEIMYRNLIKKGVAAVYGRHSFLGDQKVSRWKYALYDIGKDLIHEIRNLKRPYLNAYGMSFGYVKALGLKEGFITRNIAGEDGRLCFDLMKYGKIKLIRNNKSRVWTEARNFEKDGGLFGAVKKRILREMVRLDQYLKNPIPHDTKTSNNSDLTIEEYKQRLKEKFRRILIGGGVLIIYALL